MKKEKKPYQCPTLSIYGDLVAITRSGGPCGNADAGNFQNPLLDHRPITGIPCVL